LNNKKNIPAISVCIPVFNTENSLLAALESVAAQSFTSWEIIIVNDGSKGKDDNKRDCYKIVKAFKKSHKIPSSKIIYREHSTNLGLLEARRTAVESAQGLYIAVLDSDDSFLPQALSVLYARAVDTGADIVNCGAEIKSLTDKALNPLIQKRISEIREKCNNIYPGDLYDSAIFDGFLINNNHSGFLWGKLIKKEIYQAALKHIPFTNCVFAEDFLQYFFISYEAHKYTGLQLPLYSYTADTGISSFKQINSLEQWQKICSTASVFSILFTDVNNWPEGKFTQQHKEALQFISRSYLANNIKQLKEAVAPHLYKEAFSMLCDYWGKDYVDLFCHMTKTVL